uniref:AN1-type zinc finger protein 2B n=1 Tax=Cacopsylla melanoneura TaxID=428564 RepID=A0A8D8RV19_9HEMI
MEFPHLGKHCSMETCKKLDFLPVKCDACLCTFCSEHMTYLGHSCKSAAQKDVQVPVCPLCNQPVPTKRGELPDYAVGLHIDNNCSSDTAQERRKIFTNKCSVKSCKGRELIPVKCYQCTLNFCLKHRHPNDHNCEGQSNAARNKALESAQARLKNQQNRGMTTRDIQGNMAEDEALARALQISMQEVSHDFPYPTFCVLNILYSVSVYRIFRFLVLCNIDN